MKKLLNRRHLALAFSVLGVFLMGVDIMLTRNFFTHIGELMAASILCFAIGIVLDRTPQDNNNKECRPHCGKSTKGLKPS